MKNENSYPNEKQKWIPCYNIQVLIANEKWKFILSSNC